MEERTTLYTSCHKHGRKEKSKILKPCRVLIHTTLTVSFSQAPFTRHQELATWTAARELHEGIAQGLTSQQGIALRKKTTQLLLFQYSQEPSVEVFCPTVNIIILKLGY